jgi:tetratricopeptide (TPR) repeat protein
MEFKSGLHSIGLLASFPSIGLVLAGLFVVTAGCGRKNQPSPPPGRPDAARDRTASPTIAAPVIERTRQAGLAQIRQLISRGAIDEANRSVQDYLLRSPNDPDAMVLAAQVSSIRGRIDQAVGLLDSAAKLSPQQGKYWRARAALMLAQAERWEEAISRLESLVAADPEFDEARLRLADVLNLRGFRFDANQHVRRLCQRTGATPDQLRGLMVPARSHLVFAEKPDIDDIAQVEKAGPLSVARALLSEGDVREAYQALRRSRLVEQRNPCALALYGQLLLAAQEFEAFEDWLGDAEVECRRYPSYWLAVGGWAMRQQQYDAAVRMFAEAVLREPGDAEANRRLVQALAAAGQTEASERFRQRCSQMDDLIELSKQILVDPRAHRQEIFELVQRLQNVGRMIESLGWYRVGAQLTGASPEALPSMAQIRQMVAQLDEAKLQRQLLCDIDLSDFPLDLSSLPQQSQSPGTVNRPPPDDAPPRRQPSFVNVASSAGLNFRYFNGPTSAARELLIYQQIGAGVACLDYDLDGKVDFYLGQASANPPDGPGTRPNQLARNLGDQFFDASVAARCDDRGYSCGVTSGDWNQDGFADLVVGNMSRNTLLINQGDGTFREQSGDAVWDDPKFTASLAMGDIDGDHLPDIVEVNYLDDPQIYDPIEREPDGTPLLPGPQNFQPSVDRIFRSRGDGSMNGQELGGTAATGLGVLLTDIDGKPGNEIFVANDHTPNQLWEQQKTTDSTSWRDAAAIRGVAYGATGTELGCMGIAAADFDENGRLDLHVTNFEDQWSNHYMQNASGFFDDLVVAFGLEQPTFKMVGFGTQAFDYDNNSLIDLVIGNGHIDAVKAEQGSAFEMPTQMFALEGSHFQPLQPSADPAYWNGRHVSRALAICDWNNDGRTDFVVTDLIQPLALLENRTDSEYHWLQLQLVGTRCERDAIGASIRVQFGGRTITKVIQTGDGYMCRNQSLIFVGLADHDMAESIEILWPDGDRQTLKNVTADRRWLIVQGEDEPFALEPPAR